MNGNVKSMSTTTTTTRDRGDRYGPIEWAQQLKTVKGTVLPYSFPRALGPELIQVYRQSARIHPAVGCRYFPPGLRLPSHSAISTIKRVDYSVEFSLWTEISLPHARTSVHVACGCGSVVIWRRCNVLCISGFVDDVVFSNGDIVATGHRSSG